MPAFFTECRRLSARGDTEKPPLANSQRPRAISASTAKQDDKTLRKQRKASQRPAKSAAEDQILFAWLHLSDLYFGHGNGEHGSEHQRGLCALRRDVQEQVRTARVPVPHGLLITGDIACSGAMRHPMEYQEAAEYLKSIAEELKLTRSDVFLVPGNHDVQRAADQERNLRRLLRELRAGEEALDDVLANIEDTAMLHRRQANYWVFAKSFGPASVETHFHTRHSLVHNGLKVRILGLNTALLAADDQDHGRLRLGNRALAQLLTEPAPATDELVIAMSHHSLGSGWLADEKEVEAWLCRHAHIHLSGHVHEVASERLRSGSGGELVRVTAGASHGDKTPNGVLNDHGYNFAAVVYTTEGDLVLRIWPRRFSDANKAFRVDIDNLSPDRPYAEHLLRLPWRPPGEIRSSAQFSLSVPAFGSFITADSDTSGLSRQ